jgi:GAF domain-containing protein/HAMP domain-containing protein
MTNQLLNRSETEKTDQALNGSLFAIIQYIPLLFTLMGIGFLTIYVLAWFGILGNPAWQLLAVTGVVLFVMVSHLQIIRWTRSQQLLPAYALYSFAMAAAGILFVLFWQGIFIVAILIAWIVPLSLFAIRSRRLYIVLGVLISAIAAVIMMGLDGNPPFARLSNGNPAGFSALILIASTVVLFIFTAIISRLLRYRTLQNRLVDSFIFIIAVPILFITVISVFNAFTNSQNQFRDTLQAISSLKQDEVDSTIQRASIDLSTLQFQYGLNQPSILYVVQHQGDNDQIYQTNYARASLSLRDYLNSVQYRYEEALVLDPAGKVLLASYSSDEGLNLGQETFFQKGSAGNFTGLNVFPGKRNTGGDYKFIISGPLYASKGRDVLGVMVLVAKSDGISHILETTPGLANAETYLVDGSLKPITLIRSQPAQLKSLDIVNIIKNKSGTGSGIYDNYAGLPVLGYYQWYPSMQAALVAEIPESDIFNKALSTLLVGSLIGIFTIVIAVVTVIATSRAISEPVSALVNVAEQFAAGDLDARAESGQDDEVGDLARSFNSMADQLKEIIGNLELRVSERTKDLERQTLRLRTAAEVARDAASAPNLDELLVRSGQLIRDRFNLYHTGIFLLDEKKEYAVLRASPTEAGRKLMENGHRLRVGEQGIVGRVADTGEPRIALDTGIDPVYFSNPLLPATRSEMSLALKSNEGIIGVLDIQSDQPEAFTQDDIAVMQVLADQLATAIERSRLLDQVESNLSNIERTYSRFTEQSWMSFERSEHRTTGYKYDNVKLEPVDKIPEEAMSALQTGMTRIPEPSGPNSGSRRLVAIPIRLRGDTIGVVNVYFQGTQAPRQTIGMIEQIADRLATALENARLLEDSMRTANKERVIGEITSKISASVNIQNVLQTAVEELGRAIPGSDVVIQFQSGREVQG